MVLSAMFQGGSCIATCNCAIVLDRSEDGAGLPDEFNAKLGESGVMEPDPLPCSAGEGDRRA